MLTMRLLSTTACKALLTVIALAIMPRDGLAAEIVRVVVWDEQQPAQKEAYDNFLGNCIADHLKTVPGLEVRSVNINDGEQGLSPAIVDFAEVLVWWGHVRQAEIKPETGRDIVARVKAGRLTLVAVHSAHWATPFMEGDVRRAISRPRSRPCAHGGTLGVRGMVSQRHGLAGGQGTGDLHPPRS